MVVEGDLLTTVKKTQVLEEDRSNVAALIKEINERSRKFAEIIVRFAPRLANRMAHAMIEEGREFLVPAYWIEEVPIRVEEEVAKDRREYSVCTDGEGGRGVMELSER